MKREIKFRAWDGKEMIYISDFYWFEENGVHDSNGSGHYIEFKIMQFTGLKDKNGKEIYEGDIVHIIYDDMDKYPHKDYIEPIEWGHYDDGEYVSNVECWMAGDEPLSDKGGSWGSSKHEYEVIGNIYENPELLKQ